MNKIGLGLSSLAMVSQLNAGGMNEANIDRYPVGEESKISMVDKNKGEVQKKVAGIEIVMPGKDNDAISELMPDPWGIGDIEKIFERSKKISEEKKAVEEEMQKVAEEMQKAEEEMQKAEEEMQKAEEEMQKAEEEMLKVKKEKLESILAIAAK